MIDGVSRNPLRITGMASGIDTDEVVKGMLLSDKNKIDKVNKDRQTIQWKQELYREIIDDVNEFKNSYFDVLGDDYILGESTFAGFDETSSSSSVATATASTGAIVGDYTVNVTKLADEAEIAGSTLITNDNKSSAFNLANWDGNDIGFDVNGTAYQINLDGGLADVNAVKDNINLKISQNSNLSGKISASVSGGVIKFNVISSNETIKIDGASTTVVSDLDNLKGKVLNPSAGTNLKDLNSAIADTDDLQLDITYDGTNKIITIEDAGTKSIDDIIEQISDETSGKVIASFSELTGQFTLKTSETGSAKSLQVNSIDADLQSAIGISAGGVNYGQDADVTITPPGAAGGTQVIKSTNSFSIDNMSYSINTTGVTTVTVTSNVDDTFEKIEGFIGKYNEIIEKISSKLEEKKSYSYKPLTDEQKESMSEDEIEKWEKKAKEGLLRNDNSLNNMLMALRQSFFDSVEGSGIAFSKNEIGLDTSEDVTQRGKIIIKDANKFKEALKNKGQQIMRLFVKRSDTSYSRNMSASDRKNRYDEEGIFQRIKDIIEDNIGTYRDSSGKKGILIERAGIKNDTTLFTNALTKQIQEKDSLIKELNRKMYEKENRYYIQFSKLEQAMNQINAQSNWLYSQMGM